MSISDSDFYENHSYTVKSYFTALDADSYIEAPDNEVMVTGQEQAVTVSFK